MRPESAHHNKRPESGSSKYGQLIKPVCYTNLEGQVDYLVDKMLNILSKVMMSELIESAETAQNDHVLNLKIRNIKKVTKRSSTANNASRQRPDH
jgi:hypothetical protein